MLNQDICNFYGCLAVDDEYGGVVLAEEEGKRIAKALGENSKVSTWTYCRLGVLDLMTMLWRYSKAVVAGARTISPV